MPFIDTHCHLESLKSLTLTEMLRKAQELNVTKFVTIATEPMDFDSTYQLSQQHSNIYSTQGVHPHEAAKFDIECEKKIITRAQDKKMVAIGEIGLDYHYDYCPRDKQKEIFERQLNLACELNLPVVIHTREADEDTKTILQKHSSPLKRKGVLHSFTSSLELLKFAVDQGFFIGFNGILTFKNANNVQEALRQTPLSQIVIETDAPYLAPMPHRGKENTPLYLPLIAQKVADLKSISIQELEKILWENSMKLFAIDQN